MIRKMLGKWQGNGWKMVGKWLETNKRIVTYVAIAHVTIAHEDDLIKAHK